MIKTILTKTNNCLGFIQKNGIKDFLNELSYRISNQYYENKYGVNTSGMIKMADLGYNDPDFIDYGPIGYKDILAIIKLIPLDLNNAVFVDYGSGMGRAIVAAATFPFKRVIGIEISDKLIEISSKNIRVMKHKRAKIVECLNLDATKYRLDEDINLIYFFNPFKGAVLEKVINNIFISYNISPRIIYIIYFNSIHFENAIMNFQWISKIYETWFYPNYSCRVYRTEG